MHKLHDRYISPLVLALFGGGSSRWCPRVNENGTPLYRTEFIWSRFVSKQPAPTPRGPECHAYHEPCKTFSPQAVSKICSSRDRGTIPSACSILT